MPELSEGSTPIPIEPASSSSDPPHEAVPRSLSSSPTSAVSDAHVSHDPPPPLITNAHPMVTRGKKGIFKPKTFLSMTTDAYLNCEPPNVKEALKSSHW